MPLDPEASAANASDAKPSDSKQSDAQQSQASLPPADAGDFIGRMVSGVSTSPAAAQVESATLTVEVPRRAKPRPRTIACIVTHGMGQQVRFETVASIAEAFVRGRRPKSVHPNRVRLSEDGDLLSRMELVYAGGPGEPETHLHLYEGYWSPLTEGKITYLQAIGFLLSGAWEGLRTSFFGRRFDRWIFGRMHELPVKPNTWLYLVLTLLFLLIGLGIAALAGLELAHFWDALKTIAGNPLPAALHLLLSKLATARFFGTLGVAGLALGYRYFLHKFLIEYLGDVAIYISSYKVSVFEEVRTAIQKVVVDLGKQVLSATVPPEPGAEPPPVGHPDAPLLYDGILFVGHSLGSVITYDLVNALITWDRNGCDGQYRVVQRIQRLITFGSPLDKTAFLFRTQTSEDHHYREAMAGLMQPLILDYALRPFPWVNLYSHNDVVSGSLAYYDLPKTPHGHLPPGFNPVENILDPVARIPLYAHLQYWKGDLLAKELLAGLDRVTAPRV